MAPPLLWEMEPLLTLVLFVDSLLWQWSWALFLFSSTIFCRHDPRAFPGSNASSLEWSLIPSEHACLHKLPAVTARLELSW